jgi:hypothetical protein
VPTAGRTPVDCLRSLLELDTLGLGSRGRTTRLASLGLTDAELQRVVLVRTRGGEPERAPRTVALADFQIVCFEAAQMQPDLFWEGAREALGKEVVDEDACGVAAGVVGGMGPLAGAVYQQRLGAMLVGFAPNASTHGALRDEADSACIEVFSNPQLAVDVRALLQTVGDSERMLIEQRTFLARPDFSNFAGPSNAWHEISFRLLVRASLRRCRARQTGGGPALRSCSTVSLACARALSRVHACCIPHFLLTRTLRPTATLPPRRPPPPLPHPHHLCAAAALPRHRATAAPADRVVVS